MERPGQAAGPFLRMFITVLAQDAEEVCSSALLSPAILGRGRKELPLKPLSEFAEPAHRPSPLRLGT